jgi:hypothetical protein
MALGGESATEWPALVDAACAKARVTCKTSGSGYGPSDHTSFYAAGVPVLHFFSGAHSDYHKPSDTIERVNAAGAGKAGEIVARIAAALLARDRLTYQRTAAQAPGGDVRSSGASLGTVPDYAGPPGGQRGVLLAGVRPGGAAELAGMQRGDILVKLGPHDIGDVHELMFALEKLKPDDVVTAVVLRNGQRLELQVTMQRARAH